MLWRYAQHLFHSYGELWLVRGHGDKALSYADECLRLAESSDSRKNIVKARRLRGQVFLARGALAEAETEFDQALAMARQVANPPQLWKTLVTLGEPRRAQGKLVATQQAYHEATSIIDSVAAALRNQSLRGKADEGTWDSRGCGSQETGSGVRKEGTGDVSCNAILDRGAPLWSAPGRTWPRGCRRQAGGSDANDLGRAFQPHWAKPAHRS
jgi:tetratricopeptide (TPR) repeat protein